MSSEGGEGPETTPTGGPRSGPTTLTGQHRALDEAAAQLVAAWDVDIDSHTPAEGQDALARLGTSAPASSFPPAPKTPSMPMPSSVPPLAKSSPKWPWLAAGAAVLVGVGLLVGSRHHDAPTVTAASTEPPAPLEATGSTAAPEAPPTNTAPAPPSRPAPVVEAMPAPYRLTVRTIPKTATLTIAGQAVDNPYRGQHASGDTLRIEARAAGHETAVRELELSEDTDLMVTLVPEERAAPAPAAKKRRASAKKARRRAAARKKARARAHRQSKARRKARPAKPQGGESAGFVSSNPYQ